MSDREIDIENAINNAKNSYPFEFAPECDKRLIDAVRRVIFEQRGLSFPYFDLGGTSDGLKCFFKEYHHETEIVLISCSKNQSSGKIDIYPKCLMAGYKGQQTIRVDDNGIETRVNS